MIFFPGDFSSFFFFYVYFLLECYFCGVGLKCMEVNERKDFIFRVTFLFSHQIMRIFNATFFNIPLLQHSNEFALFIVCFMSFVYEKRLCRYHRWLHPRFFLPSFNYSGSKHCGIPDTREANYKLTFAKEIQGQSEVYPRSTSTPLSNGWGT